MPIPWTKVSRVTLAAISICLVCTSSATAEFRFGGSPDENCSSFLVTEVGIGGFVGDKPAQGPYGHVEQAMMFMIRPRTAVGLSHYLTYEMDNCDARGGLRVHVRQWLNRRFSVNVAGGLLLYGERYYGRLPRGALPAFTGQVSFGYRNVLWLYGGVDALKARSWTSKEPYWFWGIKTGGYPGAVLSVLSVAAAVLERWGYQWAG